MKLYQEIKRMIQGNELAHYNTLFWEAAEAEALEPPR